MSILNVNDIIASYNKFQEDMLVIDYANHRTSVNGNVKYFDIKLKKEDNSLSPLRIKFFNQEVCNRIKGPSERTYGQIKICIKNKSAFTDVMRLICESFNKLIIKDTCDKTLEINGISVPCIKPNTPMQISTNTETGNIQFKEPLFWIVPSCKRTTDSEFKEFDFRLFSLDYLDEETNSPQEIMLSGKPVNDNNIHKVLSKGSVISGIISMQVIASKLSFSLNTKINEKLYVKQPINDFDKEDLSIMLS